MDGTYQYYEFVEIVMQSPCKIRLDPLYICGFLSFLIL